MAVVARLRDDAVLPLRRREEVRLLLGVADRLLDVDVDALLHAGDRDGRVRLLVRGDDRRVHRVAHLLQKDAVVRERLHLREVAGRRELREALLRVRHLGRVGVDHRDDLLVQALRHEHGAQPPAAADERDADLPPRRNLPCPALAEGRAADAERGRARSQPQEVTSFHFHSLATFHFLAAPFVIQPPAQAFQKAPSASWPDPARTGQPPAERQHRRPHRRPRSPYNAARRSTSAMERLLAWGMRTFRRFCAW